MTEKKSVLEFEVPQKEVLNSNSMPSHFIVKGNMVANLREMGAQAGALLHPEEVQPVVFEKLHWLKAQQATQLKKSRLRKRLLKDNEKGLFEVDVEAEIAKQFPDDDEKVFDIPPLFDKFAIRLIVMPPTRRRFDPPNLWPSLKALGDGLTDAGLWEDDSFEYMVETSFRAGGLSGIKGVWKLRLEITEVEDLSDFVVSNKE